MEWQTRSSEEIQNCISLGDLFNGFAITFMKFNWRWEKTLNGLSIWGQCVQKECVVDLWIIIPTH